MTTHFLYHPDHVRRVLSDQHKTYKRSWHYRMLRRLVGNGLVVNEGESWLRQRRLAQPAFHRQRLAGYARVMAELTADRLAAWEDDARTGRPIEMVGEMARLTMAIASRTLFGQDAAGESSAVGEAFGNLRRCLEHRFNHPFTSPPRWAPTPRNRQFREAVRVLDRIVFAIIETRRSEGEARNRDDLLSMLLQARDEETGEAMSDRQLRDEALTYFIAGYETTAVALAWTWSLLGTRPHVRDRIADEAIGILGDRTPSMEDLSRLTYARMTIEEAMRLYPPVWLVTREASRDDEIGGYRIPAGSVVVLSPYVTHRHPDFWERPEEFDPDRFTPERAAQRPKGAYFPFLAGPRQCIGNEFAMLETQLVVAMTLRKFDMDAAPGPVVRPKAALTLHPNGPLFMKLKPRRGPL